jgi:hypothetical protein
VQAIISMAHALGLEVVAEGVETERQLNCLRRMECDLFQGFLLSRPLEAGDVARVIGKINPTLAKALSGEILTPEYEGGENGGEAPVPAIRRLVQDDKAPGS